jgi:hypothetical protein
MIFLKNNTFEKGVTKNVSALVLPPPSPDLEIF